MPLRGMYYEYRQVGGHLFSQMAEQQKILHGEVSIDINELNAEESDSMSSEETVIPMPTNGLSRAKSPLPPRLRSDEIEEEEPEEEGNPLDEARAHWIQLYKVNIQNQIVQQMFVNMLRDHPQTRPIWQFTRNLNPERADWTTELSKNIQFRHHCASIQAALTMVMDNLDDTHSMGKLLQEIGAHHFFYDAYEPHLELMQEDFMNAIRNLLADTTESPDERTQNAWVQLWALIKENIGIGISNQRQSYLVQCVTTSEMMFIRKMWEKVESFGLEEGGSIVTSVALTAYEDLIARYRINLNLQLNEQSEVFKKFSAEVMQALKITVNFHSPESGFASLPIVLKEFVQNCIVMDVCPTLVRKAFMEGLITMLTQILGESAMTENVIHTWSKVYRVLEQAILTNVANY